MSDQGEKTEVEQKPAAATAEQKPARNGRGRGQRGGKGDSQEYRPKTAKEPRTENKLEAEGEKRVDNKGRGGRGGRGQRQAREKSASSANRGGGRGDRGDRGRGRGGTYAGRKEEPENKDSYKYKFHKPEFRIKFDFESIEITQDMEIEDRIAKEDLLAEPDKEAMLKDLEALDKEIIKIQKTKERLILQKKKKLGGGCGGVAGTFFEQQKILRTKHKELSTGMHKLIGDIKNLNNLITELDNKRDKLLQNMDKNCTNEKDIQDQIHDSQRQQQTQSNSRQVEQGLVKQIEKLQKSLPFARDLSKIKPEKDAMYKKKKEIQVEVEKERANVKEVDLQIKEIQSSIDKQKENKTELDIEIEEFNTNIDEQSADMKKKYASKDETKEAFWKNMFDWRAQQDHIKYVDWQYTQRTCLIEGEVATAKHVEQMKQEVQFVSNPNRQEIEACQFLINMYNNLKKSSGLVRDSDVVARELQEEQAKEAIRQKQEQLKSLKKIEVGLTKEQRQQDEMICIGQKGKNKQNRRKKVVEKAAVEEEDQQYEEPFHHDLTLVQKCSKINVSPPEIPTQLDEKIEEVEKKMAEYELAGKGELEKQILNKEKNIESYKKKQAENLAFDMKMAREQGINNRTDRGGRGGRGGRGRGVQRDREERDQPREDQSRGDRGGRGGRGNRGAARGGKDDRQGGFTAQSREDQNLRTHEAMIEFAGDEDEEKPSKATAEAPAQKGKGKKDNFKLNIEQDFGDLSAL